MAPDAAVFLALVFNALSALQHAYGDENLLSCLLLLLAFSIFFCANCMLFLKCQANVLSMPFFNVKANHFSLPSFVAFAPVLTNRVDWVVTINHRHEKSRP